MAFDRNQDENINPEVIPEKIIKIEGYKRNKAGDIIKGDYPKDYIEKLPAWLSTPGIMGNKNDVELNYDRRAIYNILRLNREFIDDEDYDLMNLLNEWNMEISALSNNTRNKEGKLNWGFMTNASINVSESSQKIIENPQEKRGFWNKLFMRK